MAFLRKKVSRGKTYYYAAESKRINGKPRVVNEVYLGTLEGLLELKKSAHSDSKPEKLQVLEWGSLAAVEAIEKEIGLIDIIDQVVSKRKQGHSVGEYLYLSAMNRCIEPRSKQALADWFKKRALFDFRQIDLSLLTSQRYWDHFDKVSESDIEEIGRRVAEKVVSLYQLQPDWMLFDTTNFFTFFDAENESELAKTGHNKQGRDNLRQIGLSLLVDRYEGIPLFHKLYPGNNHDSKLLNSLIDEMLKLIRSFGATKEKLTLVFDKGMNSQENMAFLDDDLKVHFITSYSLYHAEEMEEIPLELFSPLESADNEDDPVLAYRTKMELWDKERAVVITYNPKSARKKMHKLDEKLESARTELLEIRRKVREEEAHWRDEEKVKNRIDELLVRLKVKCHFDVDISKQGDHLQISFRQKPYYIRKSKSRMGRNMIVTDRHDLSTKEIVQAYSDRNQVENRFKWMKDPYKIAYMPQYHWTDQKIRVHALTCTVALTYLAIMQLKLKRAGMSESIDTAMGELRNLHSCLLFYPGCRKPERKLEEISTLQRKALEAIGVEKDRLQGLR
jgi:transposase